MNDKFTKLIELCKNNIPLTQENVGEGMFLVYRGSFQLVIPNNNTDEHGDFFVYSIEGHDCYSKNIESKHTYHIIDGSGKFIVNGEEKAVNPGDTVVIEPDTEFTYQGNMILTFEMEPNFKEENEVKGETIDYSKKNINV